MNFLEIIYALYDPLVISVMIVLGLLLYFMYWLNQKHKQHFPNEVGSE